MEGPFLCKSYLYPEVTPLPRSHRLPGMTIKNLRSLGNDFETQFSILLTQPALLRHTDCMATCYVTGPQDQAERTARKEQEQKRHFAVDHYFVF